MSEIQLERQQVIRQIAKTREKKQRLQSSIAQLSIQVAAASNEADRLRAKSVIMAEAPARLALLREECSTLRSSIEEKNTLLKLVKQQYNDVESQLIDVNGGMVHSTVAARRGADAALAAQRLKDDKKALTKLAMQEERLTRAIRETIAKNEKMRCGKGNPDADEKHVSSTTRDLVSIQLEYEQRKKDAIRDVQDELHRLDREMERRRAESEAREMAQRTVITTKFAQAESEKNAFLREHATLRSRLATINQREEECGHAIDAVEGEIAAVTAEIERKDASVTQCQRQLNETNRSVDDLLRHSVLEASEDDPASADASWKVEKKQLLSTISTSEKRLTEMKKEIQQNANETSRILKTIEDRNTSDIFQRAHSIQSSIAMIRKEIADLVSEAIKIESANAASQKTSIIKQLESELSSTLSANATLIRENDELERRWATVEASLHRVGASL